MKKYSSVRLGLHKGHNTNTVSIYFIIFLYATKNNFGRSKSIQSIQLAPLSYEWLYRIYY